MADPVRRAIYERAKGEKPQNAYATALSDYFDATPPTVTAVDLSRYQGRAGDVIAIEATDNIAMKNVRVRLRRSDTGECFEVGDAVAVDEVWHYTATTSVPPGVAVEIKAEAFDLPGHAGEKSVMYPGAPAEGASA